MKWKPINAPYETSEHQMSVCDGLLRITIMENLHTKQWWVHCWPEIIRPVQLNSSDFESVKVEAEYLVRNRLEQLTAAMQRHANWDECNVHVCPRCRNGFENEQREQALTHALSFCVHVIEKGIEARMGDQWPAIQELLPDAVSRAKAALSL